MLEVYHIESMGTLDGPGIRSVIFLQGCPMRCGYCHNPDSWLKGQGEAYDFTSLYEIIMRYRPYYGPSGGVTLSGGDPLMQAGRLIPFVQGLKKEGIHVTLDTSGSLFSDETRTLVDLVDLVILDIKATDPDKHLVLTGHSTHKVFKNLHYLQKTGKKHWIRQVTLKGFNDDSASEGDLKRIISHPACEKFEYLEYHEMGLEKWQAWQKKYKIDFKIDH